MNDSMKNNIPATQYLIMSFLWLVIFLSPLLSVDSEYDMERATRIWGLYSGIFVVFLINRAVLMPLLLFRDKKKIYAAACIVFISIVGIVYFLNMPEHIKHHKAVIQPAINAMIISVLIIGFDLGIDVSIRWLNSERKRSELEKENSEVKLALLHKQITPHFFMNMLNNIHSLVDIDSGRAQKAIIQLSKLMSYQLYETGEQKVSLSKEVEFIENYVSLMRLRYPTKVSIDFVVCSNTDNIFVPPLIFLNFIENAFKHGVSYREESFIKIYISKEDNNILMDVSNSNHAKQANEQIGEHQGIGVDNNRKRLDLIFGKGYSLDIKDEDNIYSVKLSIPV